MNETISKTVTKPWGWYSVISEGPGYLVKILFVDEDQQLSLQSHQHRAEEWYILEGSGIVEVDGHEHIAARGFSYTIGAGQKHRLSASLGTSIRILEIQFGSVLDENDIVRYEDMYGRK